VLATLVAAGAVGFGGWKGYKTFKAHQTGGTKDPYSLSSNATQPDNTTQPTGTIRLVATGEMMAHDSVNQNAKKPDGSYDYAQFLTALKPYFDKADVRVCTQGTPSGGTQLGVSGHPNFNAPAEFAAGIASAGCNVIDLAAFHMNDKGQDGINGTRGAWDGQQDILAVAGANRSAEEQQAIRYFTVKGVKFAYLAYTTSVQNKSVTPFGINQYSDTVAEAQVKEAKSKAQFVVVSMYWGADSSNDVNAEQEAIAQKLASLNVEVVLGQGTHTLQTARVFDGTDGHQTLVWYSLGNSLNTQLAPENLIGGIAIMDIDIATRNIVNVQFLPTYMSYEWTAQQKAKQDLLARNNLKLYILDQAGGVIANSQLGITTDVQQQRVTQIMTKYKPIKVINSSEY
jgi:poly-gamma-glutamate synthesis protein (capsule biosynthesis protein)